MHESEDPPAVPEPAPEEQPEGNPEVRALIVRAVGYVEEGRRLPRPTTWKELLAGLIVWLGKHWSDENKDP